MLSGDSCSLQVAGRHITKMIELSKIVPITLGNSLVDVIIRCSSMIGVHRFVCKNLIE